MSEQVITNVSRCQRCGEDHNQLIFQRLDNAIDNYNYWGTCPTKNQPILLKVVEDVGETVSLELPET